MEYLNIFQPDIAFLLNTVNVNFMNKWDGFGNLKKIHDWFDHLPNGFDINSVGRALAQTNAKRCYRDFPDLI